MIVIQLPPATPPASVATLTDRERLLIGAACNGERAIQCIRRVNLTREPAAPLLWYPVAAEYARAAWSEALDALGWRES